MKVSRPRSILLLMGVASLLSSAAYGQLKPFSHANPKHNSGKHESCSSCHALPTKNWATAARADKQRPFPDVRTYPGHSSCFSCHTKDIYSAGGAFCGTCHTVPTMRARAVKAFPNAAHRQQFDIIFPHDVHQELLASNAPSPQERWSSAHFATVSFSNDDKVPVAPYNCMICHKPATAVPKFAERHGLKEIAKSELLPDKITKPVTASFFMTSPDSHASCFTCHYQYRNLPKGQTCNGCHAPALKPYTESRTVERYSLKFDHDEKDKDGDYAHRKKDCNACHNRIVQNSDIRTLKDADVPFASCTDCHKDKFEIEAAERGKTAAFQCSFCHTSEVGRRDIPKSHLIATNGTVAAHHRR